MPSEVPVRSLFRPAASILVIVSVLATTLPVYTIRALAGTLSGPILDEGVTAELVDVVQLPATSTGSPRARLEYLREAPDASDRLFINDMRGQLYSIQGSTVTLYLDLNLWLPLKTAGGLQQGFVSFAFHPDFATNGLFYTSQTEYISGETPNLVPAIEAPISHHAVLTEWHATDPAAATFSGTSRELMRIAAPHSFHNLGEVAFDPSLSPGDPGYGYLYVAAGEFGSVIRQDPGQLQRLDTVFGCILRIDPLGGPFVRDSITYPYGIPASNPWANDGDPDTFGEIFAYGFRNPENLHFDRDGSGRIYVGDIGESNLEEVDLLEPGANYGWPVREGGYALDVLDDPSVVYPVPIDDFQYGYTYPAVQYDHEEGSSIAGGLAVHTTAPGPLSGAFLFGDIVTGEMYYSHIASMAAVDKSDASTMATTFRLHLLHGGTPTTLRQVIGNALGTAPPERADLRFSSDRSGRLYVTTKQDGWMRELVPPISTSAPPAASDVAPVRAVPNPFNPATEILFSLDEPSSARVTVFDAAGHRVRELFSPLSPAGECRVHWDGRDEDGRTVASGVYSYRLITREGTRFGKMSLVR